MLRRWNRYWYRGEPEYDPMGLVRMLAVACYVQDSLGRDFWALRNALDMPPELIPSNFGLRLSPLPYPLPEECFGAFHVIMIAACGFAFVGFVTRPALLVVASGALYLASGYAALQLFDHELILTLSFLWILAIYPSGASFSVDAALRWWRHGRGEGRPGSEVFALRRRGAWGLRLALVTLCLIYVSAGVSKIRNSRGAWLNGETLGFYLAREDGRQFYLGATWEADLGEAWKSPVRLVDHGYGYGARPATRPLGDMPIAMRALAIGTVVFELGAIALLGPPIVAAAYLTAAFSMHTAIGYTMNLGFSHYRLYILLLIDWPALFAAMRSFRERRRIPA
jgi:hypothetical protein